jgi:hypothetical protein
MAIYPEAPACPTDEYKVETIKNSIKVKVKNCKSTYLIMSYE